MRELPDDLNRLSEGVIGAAIEVHRHLGPGLLEAVYEAALCRELELRQLPFAQQVFRRTIYKGAELPAQRLDLVVADRIVVELKAVEKVDAAHLAQLVSYLRLGRMPLGLLINFHVIKLSQGIRRRINSDALSKIPSDTSANPASSSASSAVPSAASAFRSPC